MVANMPQCASDIFDGLLPLGFRAYPDRVKNVNGVVVFRITGDGGGTWTLDCAHAPPTISKSEPTEEQLKTSCAIEVSHEDFKRMMVDPHEGIALYFANKLQVSGDLGIVLRMRVFFDLTRRNPGVEAQ